MGRWHSNVALVMLHQSMQLLPAFNAALQAQRIAQNAIPGGG